MKGKIITYYGNGEGKTMAAIGHAIRIVGHKRKAAIIQFMKGRKNTGEYNFLKNMKNIEIYLCGAPEFLKGEEFREEHYEKVKQGLEIAKKILRQQKIDLLILDEILYAIRFRLVDEKKVLDLLDGREKVNIILTGRNPGREILRRSDIITEIKEVKHHYKKDKETIPGMDY